MTADAKGPLLRKPKPGAYFGVPMPVWVVVLLAAGLLIGLRFRGNRIADAIYTSGTIFPKAVVTFATLVIFALLAGATAKLVLHNRQVAGRLFGSVFVAYVVLGIASLVYVTLWIPILTTIPLAGPNAAPQGADLRLHEIGHSFSTLFSEQPLVQALIVAVIAGYLSASVPVLRSVARGLIMGSQAVLWLFQKLLWYYPLMIGCLAIGIPTKFGLRGIAAYGRTTLWVALVTVTWSILLVIFVKLVSKRTWKQIGSYYASVWPTGFGTGGSYETLAMNLVSAESELGLPREMAEVSIVFGTVLNKSCAAISVLLVTISVARLLRLPISLVHILVLVPPVLVLSLESPGIPGGAAFFMSPIVGALLHVRDIEGFVATFVTMYTGLIPMFSTAGNTTNNGLVGALLTDRFCEFLKPSEGSIANAQDFSPVPTNRVLPLSVSALIGWILMALGAWMIVSPQAQLGLEQLKWMHKYAFRGELVLGALLTSISAHLVTSARDGRQAVPTVQQRPSRPEPPTTTANFGER